MNAPLLVILMGSRSDESHARKIAEAAAKLGIESVLRVGSAHKTPARILEILEAYEADPRSKVYITVAGRSNALSGFVDGAVSSPVVACPPPTESYGGADLWSSLRMPSGIAPALVMEPANAALFAAKIFALSDASIRQRIEGERESQRARIAGDDAELAGTGGRA